MIFLPKITTVRPKCVSWRFNQEWRSIGADTVCDQNLNVLLVKQEPINSEKGFFEFIIFTGPGRVLQSGNIETGLRSKIDKC